MRADLLALGVPPGKATFSFDVYGEGVQVARSPGRPRRVTHAVPPPKPTDPRWRDLGGVEAMPYGESAEIYRLRWSAPSSYADNFLIYNTWECPRESKNAGMPCFVPGTPVDASQLDLLEKAPGRARSVEIRLSGSECGPTYGTILMRARNAFGASAFTIVDAALVPDPREHHPADATTELQHCCSRSRSVLQGERTGTGVLRRRLSGCHSSRPHGVRVDPFSSAKPAPQVTLAPRSTG